MDKKDRDEFERLYKLKAADMKDKNSALDLIRRHIDSGAAYCLHCDAAIRAMFNRLKSWYDTNKDKI
ncbi:MAG: hypothetical protein ACOVK2_03000 [Candidatus Fonsibacter sp.]